MSLLSLIAFVHIILAVFLIIFVLLQDSKGGAAGIFGGGSSRSVFGSTGGVTFLSKATTAVAILFSVTCLSLAYMTSTAYKHGGSVFDAGAPVVTPPASTPAVGTTPEPATQPASQPATTAPSPETKKE
jgi:preprotein translocase subunit SecG